MLLSSSPLFNLFVRQPQLQCILSLKSKLQNYSFHLSYCLYASHIMPIVQFLKLDRIYRLKYLAASLRSLHSIKYCFSTGIQHIKDIQSTQSVFYQSNRRTLLPTHISTERKTNGLTFIMYKKYSHRIWKVKLIYLIITNERHYA